VTGTDRRIRLAAGLLVLAAVLPARAAARRQAQPPAQTQIILNITVKDYPDYCRIAFSSPASFPHRVEKNGAFLIVRIDSSQNLRVQREPFRSRWVRTLGWSKAVGGYTVTIEAVRSDFDHGFFTLSNPFQLILDIRPAASGTAPAGEEAPAAEAEPKEAQQAPAEAVVPAPRPAPSAEAGARKVKTVVIDPGHGGMEAGARGKFGALEKDVTLALALKLKAAIERNLAFRVILTRDRDTDVSLVNRAALANNNKADLFISIHANGSRRQKAQGSETFFLSLNASDEESRRLAEMENISEEFEGTIVGDNQDEIKMILWDMAQSGFVRQSSQLAEIIQGELNGLLGTANRGIKQAPFKVLTGVACPAVLVEVAFISNPDEERKLGNDAFQDQVVQALYRGLLGFLRIYS
jgi:N-acetylmuramoyl-L-alanine amidase